MRGLSAGGDGMMQLYECGRCYTTTENQQGREPYRGWFMVDSECVCLPPDAPLRVDGCEFCRYADLAAAQLDTLTAQYDSLQDELGMVIPPTMRAQGLSFEELLTDMGIDADAYLGYEENPDAE